LAFFLKTLKRLWPVFVIKISILSQKRQYL
jgi:hypothetical protein